MNEGKGHWPLVTSLGRNVREVRINAQTLGEILKSMNGRTVFVAEGMPEDAVVVGVRIDPDKDDILLRISSESKPMTNYDGWHLLTDKVLIRVADLPDEEVPK